MPDLFRGVPAEASRHVNPAASKIYSPSNRSISPKKKPGDARSTDKGDVR
ncbi:hypothetical protein LMIY3S_04711 [Labrys miyagiensis]